MDKSEKANTGRGDDMIKNRKMAARRKLLKILPRETLEQLSKLDRPHMCTFEELVARCSENWDAVEVRDAIEKVLAIAE